MFANTLLIIAMCATSILMYALLLVIGVQPWWSPQYLIPILGELGSSTAGDTVSGKKSLAGTWQLHSVPRPWEGPARAQWALAH